MNINPTKDLINTIYSSMGTEDIADIFFILRYGFNNSIHIIITITPPHLIVYFSYKKRKITLQLRMQE